MIRDRIKYLILATLLFIPCVSFADTHTAASCKRNDINAVVQDATFITGDVLLIPTCEGTDGTWGSSTAGITIPSGKKVTIRGAGYTNTVITHSYTGAAGFNLQNTGSRVTQIGFIQTTSRSWSVVVYGQGWQIDHCQFTNSSGSSSASIQVQSYAANQNDIAGLINNNDFVQGRIQMMGLRGSNGGTLTNGYNSSNHAWDDALSTVAGLTGDGNAVYIEDNTFYKTVGGDHVNVIDAETGISFVARYNTVTGTCQFMSHPHYEYPLRGVRWWEVYGNSFTADTRITSGNGAFTMRSGTGIIFGNQNNINYGNGTGLGGAFDIWRVYATANYDTVVPWGLCDGDAIIDGNDLSNGYPCRDQIGRGSDASLWTDPTATAPDQESMPAYLFMNRIGATGSLWAVRIDNGAGDYIVANRDYYLQGASFDGTSGVGCGASRPETCTVGVAYWETTQSCTDLTGMVGTSPETPLSGTLYKCTAPNTWSEYYSPYTYPHPLRDDVGEDVIAPTCTFAVDATGLIATGTCTESVDAVTKTGLSFTGSVTGAITATYKDGMPGANPRFDLGSEVQQSDVVTADYTTPGTGIKDAAGNALANFSGASVFNGSTQNTPPTYSVTINKTGTGCTITSSPSGANCGATCSVTVDNGTVVTLGGYLENGWASITYGGDCAANGTVTVNAAKTCTVTCTPIYLLN